MKWNMKEHEAEQKIIKDNAWRSISEDWFGKNPNDRKNTGEKNLPSIGVAR